MNEQERAEEHLKTIRRLMERATIYRAISAPTALVGGVLSLVACGVYVKWFSNIYPTDDSPNSDNYFLRIWLVVLALTVAANTVFIVTGAKKRGEPIFSASMKTALRALAPAFIAGGAFTIALADQNWAIVVVAVLWPLFYGIGLLATSHFAPRSLSVLGWAFFLSGVALMTCPHSVTDSAILKGITDSVNFPSYFMAATFGIFHLIYAACVWPRKRTTAEE